MAFEIWARHRFVHEMESVPEDVEMHVLPSGATSSPNISIGQARPGRMRERMEAARTATSDYLTGWPEVHGRPQHSPPPLPCGGCSTSPGRWSVWS